jgi:hypothetical protein
VSYELSKLAFVFVTFRSWLTGLYHFVIQITDEKILPHVRYSNINYGDHLCYGLCSTASRLLGRLCAAKRPERRRAGITRGDASVRRRWSPALLSWSDISSSSPLLSPCDLSVSIAAGSLVRGCSPSAASSACCGVLDLCLSSSSEPKISLLPHSPLTLNSLSMVVNTYLRFFFFVLADCVGHCSSR